MNKKEIISLCQSLGIRPNKKFGQNFLCNPGIRQRIVDVAEIIQSDVILEIGPGLGHLTGALAERAKSLTAVEIDAGLSRYLKSHFSENKKITIIHEDFLKLAPFASWNKIISNLPYYCSSEILFKIATEYPNVTDSFVMLQREMAERITAQPGSAAYGAISVSLGLYCDVKVLFKIDKQSFFPPPDITSSFLRFRRKRISFSEAELNLFHQVVKSAFWGRRKTILKALSASPHMDLPKDSFSQALEETGIQAHSRGEDLNLEQYIQLSRKVLALIDD